MRTHMSKLVAEHNHRAVLQSADRSKLICKKTKQVNEFNKHHTKETTDHQRTAKRSVVLLLLGTRLYISKNEKSY